MMQQIAKAYANGMMQAFTGQTYDEFQEEKYCKAVVIELTNSMRRLFAAYGIWFDNNEAMIRIINLGHPQVQSAVQNSVLMKDLIWAIGEWNSIETGAAASEYLAKRYKRLP